MSPDAPGAALWRDRWMLAGLLVFVAFRAAYYVHVAATLPMTGDEGFYYQNSTLVVPILRRLLAGDMASVRLFGSELVDRGWFLPGMSVVLMPVRAIVDSVPLARVYIALVNSALFLLGVRRLTALYGIAAARIALAVVAVFPYHAAFCFTFWGDLVAGHGLFYLATVLAGIQQDLARHASLGRLRLMSIGAAIAALVYVRPNLVLMVPATMLFLFLFYLQRSTTGQALWRAGAAGAVVATIVAAALFPWSYAVSRTFGGLFVTTTSVDVNFIYAFGPSTWKNDIAPGANPWVFIFDRIQTKARSEGTTFGTVSKAWRNRVAANLTVGTYLASVHDNLIAFFFTERRFLERFATAGTASGKLDAFNRIIVAVNSALWRIGLAGSLVILLLPWRFMGPGWWVGLLHRVIFCSIALQPFLSDSAGRYYVILIPFIAASAGDIFVAVAPAHRPQSQGDAGWLSDRKSSRNHDALFRSFEWGMAAAIGIALTISLASAA